MSKRGADQTPTKLSKLHTQNANSVFTRLPNLGLMINSQLSFILITIHCVQYALGVSPICPTDTAGYLCEESDLKKYYECNSPWYVGWRDCPTGTLCVGMDQVHATIPCKNTEQVGEAPEEGTGLDFTDPSEGANETSSETKESKDVYIHWNKWPVWTVIGVYIFFSLLFGWIGCVTWPDAHESISVLFNGYLC